MKTAEEQLSTYKSVHLNKTNLRTHFIGVPAIIWSISLLLSLVSTQVQLFQQTIPLNLAMLFFAVAFIYYLILHWRLALGLLVFIMPTIYSTQLLASMHLAYLLALGVFVIGWIIQFIGHAYEKAKPAFVDDLNQLLIGPFFLIAELYFILGFEKQLERTITPMAIDKRRQLEANIKPVNPTTVV